MLPQLAITLSLLSWEPDNWFGQAAGLLIPAEACAQDLPQHRGDCKQNQYERQDAPRVLHPVIQPDDEGMTLFIRGPSR